jgi:hypothetical protein
MPDELLMEHLETYRQTKGKGKIRTAKEVVTLIERELLCRRNVRSTDNDTNSYFHDHIRN